MSKIWKILLIAALGLGVYTLLAPPPTKYGAGTTVFTNLQAGQIDATTGMSVASTPVFWVTPIATSTPLVGTDGISLTGAVTATRLYIGGAAIVTPVATLAQPTVQVLYGNTPAAAKRICKTVNVIGSATVTFPGISTPLAVTHGGIDNAGLAQADLVTTDKTSGVVTIYTYRVVLGTPAAATTVVAVDVCATGN